MKPVGVVSTDRPSPSGSQVFVAWPLESIQVNAPVPTPWQSLPGWSYCHEINRSPAGLTATLSAGNPSTSRAASATRSSTSGRGGGLGALVVSDGGGADVAGPATGSVPPVHPDKTRAKAAKQIRTAQCSTTLWPRVGSFSARFNSLTLPRTTALEAREPRHSTQLPTEVMADQYGVSVDLLMVVRRVNASMWTS